MRAGIAIALIGGLALASPALAAEVPVTASSSNVFTPKVATVTQGDTVRWTNGGGVHNVRFDDGSFQQPTFPDFGAWSVTRSFDAPGTYPYYCEAHGVPGGGGMAGSVVVNAASAGGGSPGAAPGPGGGSPTGAPPPSRGGPQPRARERTRGRCESRRRFTIRIRRPGGVELRSVRVVVNGRAVAVARRAGSGGARHTAPVDLRGLPKGVYRVRIVARTASGKQLRGVRTYRTCAAERTPAKPPRL